MNGPLKRAVKALLNGNCDAAKHEISQFNPEYGCRILTQDCQLTPFGIEEAAGYPLNAGLKRSLRLAVSNGWKLPEGELECHAEVALFRIAEDNGRLTQFGRLKAIEQLTLVDQCQILGLKVRSLDLPAQSRHVEVDVTRHLESRVDVALACEGMVFRVLISLCACDVLGLDDLGLLEAHVISWPVTERARPGLAQRVSIAVKGAMEATVRAAFRRLHPGSFVESHFPKITEEALICVFNAIGVERLAALSDFFLENPYGHRNGWPDITVVRNGQLDLWEVKVKDKLHYSQVRTLPRIESITGAVGILRVNRL